jgi:hypothetical protein
MALQPVRERASTRDSGAGAEGGPAAGSGWSREPRGAGSRIAALPWRVILLVALLIGVRVAVVAVAVVSPADAGPTAAFWADAARYHQIADHAGEPYRDFAVEYPPVTLALIEAVNGPDRRATADHLAVASLLLELAVVAALAFGWGRIAAIAYLVLGLPFLLLPFVYFRIDLLSVALALWGLALVRRGRETSGGLLLTLAIFAKLWPLALVPWLVVRRKWRALGTTLGASAAGALLWLVASGTGGITQVITFRHARGWQIESLVGGVSRLVVDQPARIESGAVRVGDAPSWASPVLGIVIVALVAWIWLRAERSASRSPQTLDGLVPLGAVCVLLLCSPVFSPQYLVWLLPFAAIAWKPQGGSTATTLVGIATLLTVLLATGYVDLTNGATAAELLVVARNLVLVAVVVLAVRGTRSRVAGRAVSLPRSGGTAPR